MPNEVRACCLVGVAAGWANIQAPGARKLVDVGKRAEEWGDMGYVVYRKHMDTEHTLDNSSMKSASALQRAR